ncbi:hypothetical protein FEM48_Zijuj07G0067800 [Ziziphus jujuba var. spinosa]|uniref:Uncharacterized protein n=1 Tax=Ziziphus jujuba var. spinosa TaxID=714518 RepID=A0A978V339_ZIZJJ|nr:hypothetical protein FEM48_Zijuj07G0067800 [Ziziphus jujuba var. spinosa]
MGDQFPKMETFMPKDFPSYFPGIATGSNFLGDPNIWNAPTHHQNQGSKSLVSSSPDDQSSVNPSGSTPCSSDVQQNSIPVNFLKMFPELSRAQVSELPLDSPPSSSSSKFPNLTLFLQEPTILDHLSSSSPKNEPIPSSSFQIPQQLSQVPDMDWLRVHQNLSNFPSKGFNDYWLSTTKTQPMKYTGRKLHNHHQNKKQYSVVDQSSSSPPTSIKKEQNLKMNNNGFLAQNSMRKEWQFGLMENKVGENDENMNDNGKKSEDLVTADVEAVQLSRMPSLDMDIIWDALLVSDT